VGIKIIKPGLLTTIQDNGRFGYRKEGIIVSGAMDGWALRIGNLLTGNDEKEAGLEITQQGPVLFFEAPQLIAITGADLSPTINQQPVPLWRPVFVNKGSVMEFGKPHKGCRAYVTFAGGLPIPQILGSRSTYLHARIGGWQGRALQQGDIIPFNKEYTLLPLSDMRGHKNAFTATRWTISPDLLPMYEKDPVIRMIKGPEYELFTEESKDYLTNSSFQISPQSDRMGYRLKGPALSLKTPGEMLSTAVTFGTIQVPASGSSIILMADHQTTGGYPRIGQVVSADFSRLAQAPACSFISFQEVSLKEAQQLFIRQEKKIQLIKRSLTFMGLRNLLQ
jgi:antagonist of KipI